MEHVRNVHVKALAGKTSNIDQHYKTVDAGMERRKMSMTKLRCSTRQGRLQRWTRQVENLGRTGDGKAINQIDDIDPIQSIDQSSTIKLIKIKSHQNHYQNSMEGIGLKSSQSDQITSNQATKFTRRNWTLLLAAAAISLLCLTRA
jgi:hypothetical protein